MDSLLLGNAPFVDCQGQRLWSSPEYAAWCEAAPVETGMEVVSLSPAAATATHGSRFDSMN